MRAKRAVTLLVAAVLSLTVTAESSATALDRMPVPKLQAKAAYPFEMRRNQIDGEVVVRFTVDVEGVPQDIKVIRASRPDFVDEAVKAVAKWRYVPARVDGRAKAVEIEDTVIFRIDRRPR